jgi:hypothetical protein
LDNFPGKWISCGQTGPHAIYPKGDPVKKSLALAAAGLTGTLALGAGLAAPAQAATSATRALSQPSWCGWHPANNSGYTGWLAAHTQIHDGQGTACDVIATGGWIDQLTLRCRTADSSWVYVDDWAILVRGWVPASAVGGTLPYSTC